MIILFLLGFYFLVCVGVLLFNFWKVVSDRIAQLRTSHLTQHYLSLFRTISNGQFSNSDTFAIRSLYSLTHLIAFQRAFDVFEATDDYVASESLPVLAHIVQGLCPYYSKRSNAIQAYYSFLINRFQVMKYAPSEIITSFLLDQVQNNNGLYNLENALRAIYSSDNASLVVEALEYLNIADELPINSKLLADGLLIFAHPDNLIVLLWDNFSSYRPELQCSLLNYIRYSSNKWGTQILSLLDKTTDLELQIACLRYLGKYPEDRFFSILRKLAKESETTTPWEITAVCASELASYPCDETISLLIQMLYSKNWYVRNNAASSLKKLSPTLKELQEILDGNDRYAKEILQYYFDLPPEKEIRKGVAPT